jgi:hypothetical protein
MAQWLRRGRTAAHREPDASGNMAMAKWQWHGMAIRSKVALAISAGGNFGRAPDNRRPRGYDLRGHNGFRFKVALVVSVGGNFGRPLITVDRGDTSEVSLGVLWGLKRPWRCPACGVLGVGAPVFLASHAASLIRGMRCAICVIPFHCATRRLGTEGSSVIAHGLDAQRFF